jgi:hypothetical protein
VTRDSGDDLCVTIRAHLAAMTDVCAFSVSFLEGEGRHLIGPPAVQAALTSVRWSFRRHEAAAGLW